MTDLAVPGRLPAGVTKEGDGILVGHGPVCDRASYGARG
jgi:hypothetical protein